MPWTVKVSLPPPPQIVSVGRRRRLTTVKVAPLSLPPSASRMSRFSMPSISTPQIARSLSFADLAGGGLMPSPVPSRLRYVSTIGSPRESVDLAEDRDPACRRARTADSCAARPAGERRRARRLPGCGRRRCRRRSRTGRRRGCQAVEDRGSVEAARRLERERQRVDGDVGGWISLGAARECPIRYGARSCRS